MAIEYHGCRRSRSEEIINSMIDDILEEDRHELLANNSKRYSGYSAKYDHHSLTESEFRRCTCAVEFSGRFSLRVMEAMRSLQREQSEFPTVREIVDYIEENYRTSGDVHAQVRTTLKRICYHGFVMKLMENEYHFIGPLANAINESSVTRNKKNTGKCSNWLNSTKHNLASNMRSSNRSCRRRSRRRSRSRSDHHRHKRNSGRSASARSRRSRSLKFQRPELLSSTPAAYWHSTIAGDAIEHKENRSRNDQNFQHNYPQSTANNIFDLLRRSYERVRKSLPFATSTDRTHFGRASVRQSLDRSAVSVDRTVGRAGIGSLVEQSAQERSSHGNTDWEANRDYSHQRSPRVSIRDDYGGEELPAVQQQAVPRICFCHENPSDRCTCANRDEDDFRPRKCKRQIYCTSARDVNRRRCQRNRLRGCRENIKNLSKKVENDDDSAYRLLREKMGDRTKFTKHDADLKKWIDRCRQESRRKKNCR